MTMQNNPFDLVDLEGDDLGRRTIFEQARPDFLRTMGQRNRFSGMFDRIVNDFLGQVGSEFKQGEVPSQTFTDFVENQDFGRSFRRNDASRGGRSSLVSAANFLFDR